MPSQALEYVFIFFLNINAETGLKYLYKVLICILIKDILHKILTFLIAVIAFSRS